MRILWNGEEGGEGRGKGGARAGCFASPPGSDGGGGRGISMTARLPLYSEIHPNDAPNRSFESMNALHFKDFLENNPDLRGFL